VLHGPVLGAAIVLAVAIGVSSGLRPDETLAAALVAGSVAVLMTGARARRACLLVAVLTGAAASGALARERALASPLAAVVEALGEDTERLDAVVLLDGRLVRDAALVEGGIRTVVAVRRLRVRGDWIEAAGRAQLHIIGAVAAAGVGEWRAGRRVRVPVTLRRPRVLVNPGAPSPRRQALRRPFHVLATAKSAALADIERGAWWHEAAAALRARVRAMLARYVASPGAREGDDAAATAGAVAAAILIGDRAGLTESVTRRLQEAGTYHVIAISGGNIALVAALALFATRLVSRSARPRWVLTIAAVVAYGWVVGPEPSVTRAVAAAAVYMALRVAGLVPSPLHVVAAVAAGVALVDPLTVVDVGAWLSFGATFGIILGAGRLASRVRPGRLARPAVWLLSASVAAELALFPITAGVFARVSVAGVLLNFVAIPAMAALQLAALAVAVLGDWWPGLAAISASVVRLTADLLLGSARLIDVAPWLSWRVPPANVLWTAAYYGAVVVGLACARPPVRRAATAAAAAAALVIVTSPGLQSARPAVGQVRLTVLDVGQGDALLVQAPTGHALLVDAGGGPGSFDVGARIVAPAVWALGTRRLDWLAVTHADLDHIGGATSVVADLRPREIWEGIPVPRERRLQGVRDAGRAHAAAWRTVATGHRLDLGDLTIEVLHPPPPAWERQKVRNDDSVVLRVRYGEVEILLTGDAGAEFERAWPGTADRAAVRILKAAHHGSRTSSSAAFVEAYRPQIVLISVGRGNPFGHPAPAVLARFAAIGAEVFRTDQDGALIVETDGVLARVRALGGRAWTVGALRLSS